MERKKEPLGIHFAARLCGLDPALARTPAPTHTALQIVAQLRQTLATMRDVEERCERDLADMIQCRRQLEARIDGLVEGAIAVEVAS